MHIRSKLSTFPLGQFFFFFNAIQRHFKVSYFQVTIVHTYVQMITGRFKAQLFFGHHINSQLFHENSCGIMEWLKTRSSSHNSQYLVVWKRIKQEDSMHIFHKILI